MSTQPRPTLLVVVGTRPDVIKCSQVIRVARQATDIKTQVVATGQHRELLHQMTEYFGIRLDADLAVMQPRQTIADTAARVIGGMARLIRRVGPDLVLVQGDTVSALGAATAAALSDVPVGHIEAGLRSYDRRQPFPEEINRTAITSLATLHFAPTEGNRASLLAEGVPESCIRVTGNPVVDALLYTQSTNGERPSSIGSKLKSVRDEGLRPILVTLHRRESFGSPLVGMLTALKRLHDLHDDVFFLFPVHYNPEVREAVVEQLGGLERVSLVEPLSYPDFVAAMDASYLVISDSGGVQEEAPTLSVPLLILRDVTERPEVVECGAARLIGRDPDRLFKETSELLTDATAYTAMLDKDNPFGDGHAAERIVAAIREYFAGIEGSPRLSAASAANPGAPTNP